MTPASIRNNNPGAMEPGPSSKKFGSTAFETLRWKGPDGKPKVNRIATFVTPEHGAAAMFDLLERKYTGKPLQQAISTWCGGYWSGTYGKSVEAACGLTGTDVLTKEMVRSPAVAIPICQAMAKVEAGVDFPMDLGRWEDAHRMAFGQALAPAPSADNDVPFPKPEARLRELQALWAKLGTVGTTIAAGLTWVYHQVIGLFNSGIPAPPQKLVDSASNIGAWKGLIGGFIGDPVTLTAGGAIAAIFGGTWLIEKMKGG